MKRLMVALLCSLFFASVTFADTATVNGITWTYSVSNGKACISGASNAGGAITVPEILGGYPVTSIGDYAFRDCSSLTSVTIPEGVTSIGDYAFQYCYNLTSVTIPSSVTSIGGWAFNGCDGLKRVCIEDIGAWLRIQFKGSSASPLGYASEGLYLNGEKLTTVTIPESVTTIGSYAFYYCSGLTSVTIPEGVTSIGISAFSGCRSLTSIMIPEGVTSIGEGAFYYCTRLTSITIPSSVTSIGERAFNGCSGLTSVTISESVTRIGNYAFCDCSSLTSVTIPSSVTSIGGWAFSGCDNLTSVTILEGVTSIGSHAFGGCHSLTSVTILEGVTSIGSYAFGGCRSLTSITIPESVTKITSSSFSGCSSLTSVTIPSGVTSIGSYAFSDCSSLTSITIPSGVTSIGSYAFSDCSSLTSITIPNSVTDISSFAFSGCRGLTFVTIPESVTYIGNSAFERCSSLTSVTIPSSVIFVGESAFKDCPLYSLVFQGQVPNGFINAFKSYAWTNFNYPTEYAKEWQSMIQCLREVVGPYTQANVSVSAKMTTPKTMSVTYTIHSEVKQMAKVYALAFEDGERSFAKVVPVKTATADSPSSIPNGREVATNTPHTFIWNVPADWDTDLSKVMVEILVQEGELLPLELITIPGDATISDMTITRNALPQSELFNALLWCYASGDTALTNANGILKANGTQIANGVSLSSSGTQATALLNYLYGKMGYKVLSGANLSYAEEMTELDFSSSGLTQVAVKVATSSASEE